MKKAVWLSLWAVSLCAAVAGGFALAGARQLESSSVLASRPPERQKQERTGTSEVAGQLDQLHEAIRAKGAEIARLREELAALKLQLGPPLTPELEKELRERLERRKRDGATQKEWDKWETLRKDIIQRSDGRLRERSLTELEALMQSGDVDDLENALWLVGRLQGVKFNAEKLKPYVLNALSHDNPAVRRAAIESAKVVCSDERTEIATRMVNDSDMGIRSWAALELSWHKKYREAAIPALRSVLEEGDQNLKWRVLERLYQSAEQMDDLIVKLMGDKELEGALATSLDHRSSVSAPIVQRLSDMYEEGASDDTIMRFLDPGRIHLGNPNDPHRRQGHPCLAEDARPIVRDIYLGVVGDSLGNGRRREALEGLRKLGDPWAIPVLDEISRSPDAEGIEEELAKTIEHLGNLPSQQR